MFDCNWFDTNRQGIGYKKDLYEIIGVNTKRRLNTEEPFVLASQGLQVYYIKGTNEPFWSAIVDTKPRNLYEMPFPMDEEEPYQEDEIKCDNTHVNLEDVKMKCS